jgi:hypothetical protein
MAACDSTARVDPGDDASTSTQSDGGDDASTSTQSDGGDDASTTPTQNDGGGGVDASTPTQNDGGVDCTALSYHWDESANPGGPSSCSSATAPGGDGDCECDGARTCSDIGFCEGDARCHSPDYRWDELQNPAGPNTCSDATAPDGDADCECDGARICSVDGYCQGSSQ